MWLEWNFFQITFVRSYPHVPMTCLQVEQPCLSLVWLQGHVLEGVGVGMVICDMLVVGRLLAV